MEFKIEPDDGVYLGEIGAERVRLDQLVKALESCGKSQADATNALTRLIDAGLVVVAR